MSFTLRAELVLPPINKTPALPAVMSVGYDLYTSPTRLFCLRLMETVFPPPDQDDRSPLDYMKGLV